MECIFMNPSESGLVLGRKLLESILQDKLSTRFAIFGLHYSVILVYDSSVHGTSYSPIFRIHKISIRDDHVIDDYAQETSR